jgi:hypothetical protein
VTLRTRVWNRGLTGEPDKHNYVRTTHIYTCVYCRTYKYFGDITTSDGTTEELFNPDGSVQTLKVSALSRTYAQAIAGVPGSIAMQYNSTTYEFILSYTINTALAPSAQVTSVYLNQPLHYPNGFTYMVQPLNAASVTQNETNYLYINHAPNATGSLVFNLQPK